MQKILVHYKSSSELEPVYSSESASGADLKADVIADIVLTPGIQQLVPTGMFFEIPPGFEAQVRPRSGLAARSAVTVLNTPGTIDADYRGEVKVILINFGKEDFIIRRGDRIAQLIFAPVVRAQFEKTFDLTESVRGAGGFGSTGISD
ncbi:MAG: dUTP diphosphatase [Spirochaetales bacterium]|nr:dUTP diphosphatase [Spirochaetales bacterium]